MSGFAQDMAVKAAWGKTLTEWDRAPEWQRRDWRDRVTDAPNFEQGER